MIGAIIGDVVGSRYEFENLKSKDFPLFHRVCTYTDDSVCTITVTKVLLDNYPFDLSEKGINKLKNDVVTNLVDFYHKFPNSGFGGKFYEWVTSNNHEPYNSWGNGAGMRVSAVGWLANSIEEVQIISKAVTEVTHNHPEGIKGAQAIAMAIYLSKTNKSKAEIKEYIYDHYYPEIAYLDYEELVRSYRFDVSCAGSVPHAIFCFLKSKGFEDALRISVSIGGDSDTICCMCGAIGQAYYKNISKTIEKFKKEVKLPIEFIEVINRFASVINNESYRLG